MCKGNFVVLTAFLISFKTTYFKFLQRSWWQEMDFFLQYVIVSDKSLEAEERRLS